MNLSTMSDTIHNDVSDVNRAEIQVYIMDNINILDIKDREYLFQMILSSVDKEVIREKQLGIEIHFKEIDDTMLYNLYIVILNKITTKGKQFGSMRTLGCAQDV